MVLFITCEDIVLEYTIFLSILISLDAYLVQTVSTIVGLSPHF